MLFTFPGPASDIYYLTDLIDIVKKESPSSTKTEGEREKTTVCYPPWGGCCPLPGAPGGGDSEAGGGGGGGGGGEGGGGSRRGAVRGQTRGEDAWSPDRRCLVLAASWRRPGGVLTTA